ncbi:uncharacterized protein LOC142317392 isoform X2 [Lycorma delicatula]
MIELTDPTTVMSCINGNVQQHSLTHSIHWPGEIRFHHLGHFDLKFRKEINIFSFSTFLKETLNLLKNLDVSVYKVPKYWDVRITDNKLLNNNTCLLSYEYKKSVYIYYNPGSYVVVKRRTGYRGSKRDHSFYNVPIIPIPAPYVHPTLKDLDITAKIRHILVRRNPGTITDWLCNTKRGDTMKIKYPKKTFKNLFIAGAGSITILAYNMGIGPALSIIFHVLGSPSFSDVPIALFTFHENDRDIFWLNEMNIFDLLYRKLMIRHYVTNPSPGFNEVEKGTVSFKLLRKLLGFSHDKVLEFDVYCIIGHKEFVKKVYRLLNEDLGYGKDQLYNIVM